MKKLEIKMMDEVDYENAKWAAYYSGCTLTTRDSLTRATVTGTKEQIQQFKKLYLIR